MQVICVNPIRWDRTHDQPAPSLIEVGSRYLVVDVKYHEPSMYYQLAEFDSLYLFNANCFATLPTEDQEKEIECEHEAIIYQR